MTATNPFDPAIYPELASIHDRRSVRPNIERLYFAEGAVSQGADLNEGFSIEADKRRQLADLVVKDGDRLSGADVSVDLGAGSVFISSGVLFLVGSARSIASATLTGVPMSGEVKIGMRSTLDIITAEDDELYLGLDPAAEESYGEAGAVRTALSFAWAFDGDGGTGNFYPYVTLLNGEVISQDAPPTLSGVAQQIEIYDREAHGNYIALGSSVSALGLSAGKQVFSIGEGSTNVLGRKRARPTSRRIEVAEEPTLALVDAEPHVFTSVGTTVFSVRRPPIAAVNTIIVTKQRTVTVTKGVTDSLDDLPDDSISEIVSVVQGGTTYSALTDYLMQGDGVKWRIGGAEPLTGSSYQCTYRYLDSVLPDSFTARTLTVSGGVTGYPVFLSYSTKLPRHDLICIDRDANIVYLKGISAPVQPQPPQVPETLLGLAVVQNDWFGTPAVVNNGVRSYPYVLIDKMYNKLLDGLNLIGLQRLKSDVNARSPGVAAGTFADPLTSDYYRDAGEAQTGAVFNGSLQIAIDPTFKPINLATTQFLNFSHETVIRQDLVSGCEKINPYQSFAPLPAILTVTPNRDFWTEQDTIWLSEQTSIFGSGNEERVTNSEILQSVRSQPVRFLRQISLQFQISQFGSGETLASLVFDGVDVTPPGLSANSGGVITGSFVIPQNVASGTKRLIATGGSGTIAETTFTGEGRIETVELQRVNTVERFQTLQPVEIPRVVSRFNGGIDPQAQSFVMTESRHISSIDLRFCAIGNRANPVIIEIVTVDNGFPTTEVIAQTEIDMHPVLTNSFTRFDFAVPVFIPAGQMFAFVVKTNDPDTAIAVAERGQFDAQSQRWVTAQPYTIGTRFSSSNAVSWTVHQDSDVTFLINCARFQPTVKTVDLGVHAVTDVSDILIRANVFLPSEVASVVFELDFPGEPTIRILPDQVWERETFFTGNVAIRAVLSGSAFISPIMGRDILAIFGTMRASGTYVSRIFAMGASVRLDAIMSTKVPVGSAMTVEADAGNDAWVAVPQVSASPIDLGFIERTFSKTGFAAPSGGRLKITLSGTPAARPSVADPRAFTI